MTLNHVHLIGRFGAQVQERTLPSGDALVAFHLVLDRERPKTGTKVDAVPCHVTGSALMRRVLACEPGELLELEGALRRRFWRTPSGIGSAVEVHATTLKRVK